MSINKLRIALTVLLVAGCASVAPPGNLQGATTERVATLFGSPVAEYRHDDGTVRRFYTDQVSSVKTWRADYDANGKLIRIDPATTSAEFAEAETGKWHKTDLLEKFGPPHLSLASPHGTAHALIYSYDQYGMRPAYMYFILDANGLLVAQKVVVEDNPEGKFSPRGMIPGIEDR